MQRRQPLSWLSKNSETFSYNLLWILGSKYIFPKLAAFFNYKILKLSFSNFTFLLKTLKMPLLFSARFCRIFSLNFTLLQTLSSFNCLPASAIQSSSPHIIYIYVYVYIYVHTFVYDIYLCVQFSRLRIYTRLHIKGFIFLDVDVGSVLQPIRIESTQYQIFSFDFTHKI